MLNTKECVNCPKGFIFDSKRGNCSKGIAQEKPQPKRKYNNNPKYLNFIGMRPLMDSQLETCPQTHPYTDGQQCVVCNPPLVFNFESDTCTKCPPSTIYSINQHRCIHRTKLMASNIEEAQNWITSLKIS